MTEKDVKTKMYVQFQMLQQQLKEIQARMQEVANQLNEIKATRMAVEEVPKIKNNTEILAPLAPGIFVKSELKDNKEFHINVGSKVVVTKSVDETIKLLEEQEKEIQKVEEQLAVQWQTLMLKLQEIYPKLK
ncbi:prefoldin subunit alpha [Candidatus Woesearchaeota archaeon]|nr:prefoldin subunit alpha [Candidatus Woesearchaeota archaeon]